MGARTGLSAAAAVALAAACGGDAGGDGSGWEGRVDTLAGGGVRVVNPATGTWTDETRLHLAEELRIGALEGTGPDVFGDVADVAVDPAGRIYVLESQAQELRVFGPDGSHLYTAGGEGEGPGELNVPFGGGVFVGGDGRIWVDNSMNRRWELFSREGAPLGSLPHRSGIFGGATVMGPDGTIYRQSSVRLEGGGSRSVVLVLRPAGDSLVVADTLDVPELPESETIEASLTSGAGNRISMRLPVPFVHQPGWSVDPRGFFWVEPGDRYALVALSAEGHDTLRVVEKAHDPVPVSEAEIDEALERFESGPLAGVEVDRSRIPDHHPAIDRYLVDDTGRLWVRRPLGADALAWDVFDAEGVYLGEVTGDVDFRDLTVHAVTADAVYGVVRDELEVPYVVRLGLRAGGMRQEGPG